MSAFVKGLNKPDNCDKCPIEDFCYHNKLGRWAMGKGEECPIVPIPEKHGRLIDADALEKSVLSQCEMVDALGVPEMSQIAEIMKKGMVQEIKNAKTIIEAEGEE